MLSYKQQLYIIHVKIYQNNLEQQRLRQTIKRVEKAKLHSDKLKRALNNLFITFGQVFIDAGIEAGNEIIEFIQKENDYQAVEESFRTEINTFQLKLANLEQKEAIYFKIRKSLVQQQEKSCRLES